MDSRLQINFLDKLTAIEERTQFIIDHDEEELTDDSILDGITYVKYLYRLNMISLQDDNAAVELYHIYSRYKQAIWKRKNINLYRKLTTVIWQIILPKQYKVKKR